MKKRSLVATIAAVACIAAVGIGSTFAYFTSTTKVLGNTFTMGNVAITLDEDFNNKTDIAAGTTEASTGATTCAISGNLAHRVCSSALRRVRWTRW